MKRFILMLFVAALIACNGGEEKSKTEKAETMTSTNFYDLSFNTIDGERFDFSSLKGKNVLIVNTASECGYTPQYAALQELYEAHGGENFEIIAFPSDNFGHQEPGENAEIKEFCQKNFGVTFTLMEKSDVIGDNQNPVFQWLTKASLNQHDDVKVEWNFQKFLVDRNGQWFLTFPSDEEPMGGEILEFAQN